MLILFLFPWNQSFRSWCWAGRFLHVIYQGFFFFFSANINGCASTPLVVLVLQTFLNLSRRWSGPLPSTLIISKVVLEPVWDY